MVLPTVTQSDLDLISDPNPHSATGYQCVYARARVGFYQDVRYVAKCFKRPAGLLRTTAREAAKDVVRWWKNIYGDEWYAYFLARRERGYVLIKERLGKNAYGWRVKAYVFGVTHPIGGGQIGKVYATKAQAMTALRRWVRSTFGLFSAKAHLFMRRKATRFPGKSHTVNIQRER